ncbi:GNAT family N-acetyltransferase [Balneola sp. MJW-20]|uniref:GNAT family N-acetyltransferase n=1 Tax=Gracilimonas aurantiaca TaxID=3234185 RepID=UPI003466B194
MDILIRKEKEKDIQAIESVITEAFKDIPQSDGTEHLIVKQLRDTDAMVLSLVAELDQEIIGHIAFSEVKIGELDGKWYGLAPLSIHPDHQSKGVGSTLINEGLRYLESMNAAGCILVGEPSYYSRFGFNTFDHLRCAGIPHEYVMGLCFSDCEPYGDILYDPAFNLEQDS